MKKNSAFKIIIGVVLVGLLLVVLSLLAYRKPMGDPLDIVMAPTGTSLPSVTAGEAPAVRSSSPTLPSVTASEVPAAGSSSPTLPPATTSETPAVRSSAATTCGLSGTMTVLMIGRDEHKWNPPYGADAIRVIKVDFSNKKVDVFAFPRDLKLQTPSLAKKYNIADYKLGPVYMLVREKEGQPSPETDRIATEAIAQVLYDNFSISPDHYITLEENVLGDVVDQLNGIQVNVPEIVAYEGVTIAKGEQMLTGSQAMLYCRAVEDQNSVKNEWKRIDRQALVVKALASQFLLDPANYTKLPAIYNQLNKSIITDLTPEQVAGLMCMAKDISMDNVTMTAIAQEQVNVVADNTMVIKDAETNKIRETLWGIFGKK